MLILTAKIGHVVEIGDTVAIKLLEKSGQRVRMAIATQLAPIRINATGIIPARYSTGITGEPRYVEQSRMAAAV